MGKLRQKSSEDLGATMTGRKALGAGAFCSSPAFQLHLFCVFHQFFTSYKGQNPALGLTEVVSLCLLWVGLGLSSTRHRRARWKHISWEDGMHEGSLIGLMRF